jgi:2-haloacid dehalogenase
MPVRAFVFDAYGTLFNIGSLATRCEEIFPGKGAALNTLWRSKQLEYTWLRSLMGRYEDFWLVSGSSLQYACAALSLTPNRAQLEHILNGYRSIAPYDETVTALANLKRYRRAILSNGSPAMLAAAVTNAGLDGQFEAVISVDEAKIYKPHPSVYELALQKLSLPKSQIAFVSANGWDVAGAKAFGFYVFWINRNDAPIEELGVKPDGIIKSLTELDNYLF